MGAGSPRAASASPPSMGGLGTYARASRSDPGDDLRTLVALRAVVQAQDDQLQADAFSAARHRRHRADTRQDSEWADRRRLPRRSASSGHRKRLPAQRRRTCRSSRPVPVREMPTTARTRVLAGAVLASLTLLGALFAGVGAAEAGPAIRQPPQPKHGPGGATTPTRASGSAPEHRRRRLVRLRAGQAAPEEGSARRGHARLHRVLRLRVDARAHPPHGSQGQHRDLPPLADRSRHPVPGSVRLRAVHALRRQRDSRGSRASPCAPSYAQSSAIRETGGKFADCGGQRGVQAQWCRGPPWAEAGTGVLDHVPSLVPRLRANRAVSRSSPCSSAAAVLASASSPMVWGWAVGLRLTLHVTHSFSLARSCGRPSRPLRERT